MTEDRVIVSFVSPTSLVEDAIRGSGADLLHAEVQDLTSATALLSTLSIIVAARFLVNFRMSIAS